MNMMEGREQEREMYGEGKRERVNEKDMKLNIFLKKYEGKEKRVEK
jgi:hypothetical protein